MRNTKAKRQILAIVDKAPTPISVPDILQKLKFSVNKTTVYRVLEALQEKNLIKEVDFGEGKKRYEVLYEHHHHLVCQNCKKIEPIKSDELETIINLTQKSIAKKNRFKSVNHSLEFFGICSNCQ